MNRPFNFCSRYLFLLFILFSGTIVHSQKDGVCPPVLDIIILFDTSGGNDTVVQQQKNWTIEIVRELPVHEDAVRVGLIQYTDEAKTEFNLSRYTERLDIIKKLDTLEFVQGDTKTGVALYKADEEIFNYAGGARLKANRIIIVFTDGLSMDNPTKAAKTLRRKGVKIYTISVNSIGFVPEMLGIVGDADNIFGPTDEDRLEERLLMEVEHSRSCEVQPKKNRLTTSAFSQKTTEFLSTSSLEFESTTKASWANTAESELESSSTTSGQNATDTETDSSSFTSTEPTWTTSSITETLKLSSKPEDSNKITSSAESSSEEARASNSIEDIGMKEESTTSEILTTISPSTVSSTFSEPVQLFTVESGKITGVHHQTNLTDLLETKAPNHFIPSVHENKKKLFSSKTSERSTVAPSTIPINLPTEIVQSETTVTTISSTPTSTTICVTQPIVTSTLPSSKTSISKISTGASPFLSKLGVKKEVDPVSKFLGRDIGNVNSENDVLSADEKPKSKNSGGSNNSDLEDTEVNTKKAEVTSPPTQRFAFSTRVTFRPADFTSQTSTNAVPSTTVRSSTTVPTTTVSTTTLPSTTVSSTTVPSSTTTTVPPTSRKLTPTRQAVFNTLAAVTAFPTLLSMDKAVTLPLDLSKTTNAVRHMKKKIRRIIKRRRNILPKKVTDKVIEVKHSPTPTTPPLRSTLRPDIVEEKVEEIGFENTSGVQCPMDILFVVDSSGSIARTYDTQKDYLTLLIKKVEPSRSHRVGLIQFAGPHIQKMEWSFDTHSKNSQLLSAIRSVRHLTGTTYIGAALELSLILLDSRRKHTETTVILISDGFSQDDSTQQAKLLRQLPNVKMYAISLNKLTNTKYLTDIVGDRKNLFINDESKWFEEFFTKKLRCIPTRR